MRANFLSLLLLLLLATSAVAQTVPAIDATIENYTSIPNSQISLQLSAVPWFPVAYPSCTPAQGGISCVTAYDLVACANQQPLYSAALGKDGKFTTPQAEIGPCSAPDSNLDWGVTATAQNNDKMSVPLMGRSTKGDGSYYLKLPNGKLNSAIPPKQVSIFEVPDVKIPVAVADGSKITDWLDKQGLADDDMTLHGTVSDPKGNVLVDLEPIDYQLDVENSYFYIDTGFKGERFQAALGGLSGNDQVQVNVIVGDLEGDPSFWQDNRSVPVQSLISYLKNLKVVLPP